MITAATIIDEQIRELRTAIVEELERNEGVHDWMTVNECTVALWATMSISDQMFLLHPYRAHAQKGQQMRADARARCAEILNARAAEQR